MLLFIEETMNQGGITLENKLISIRGRYEYFRRNAEDLFTRPVNEEELEKGKTRFEICTN